MRTAFIVCVVTALTVTAMPASAQDLRFGAPPTRIGMRAPLRPRATFRPAPARATPRRQPIVVRPTPIYVPTPAPTPQPGLNLGDDRKGQVAGALVGGTIGGILGCVGEQHRDLGCAAGAAVGGLVLAAFGAAIGHALDISF